MNSQASPQS